MEHDVGAAEHLSHPLQRGGGAVRAEALIALGVVDRGLVAEVLARLGAGDDARVETLGKEDELLAPGDAAQQLRQVAEEVHLLLDVAADGLLVLQHGAVHDRADVVGTGAGLPLGALHVGDLDDVADAAEVKRIVRHPRLTRFGDGVGDEIAVGREGGGEVEAAVVDRADADEVARLHRFGHELPRRLLRPRQRRRLRE